MKITKQVAIDLDRKDVIELILSTIKEKFTPEGITLGGYDLASDVDVTNLSSLKICFKEESEEVLNG